MLSKKIPTSCKHDVLLVSNLSFGFVHLYCGYRARRWRIVYSVFYPDVRTTTATLRSRTFWPPFPSCLSKEKSRNRLCHSRISPTKKKKNSRERVGVAKIVWRCMEKINSSLTWCLKNCTTSPAMSILSMKSVVSHKIFFKRFGVAMDILEISLPNGLPLFLMI